MFWGYADVLTILQAHTFAFVVVAFALGVIGDIGWAIIRAIVKTGKRS